MQKKKILMLSDHPLSTSGVATQSRWLIQSLIASGKYSFYCFGGAIKHDSYEVIAENPDFIIKPTNGFGDKNLLRTALAQIKPDAVFLFTDPRFFIWVWEMEDEIHQVCPIVYWHLWDNPPTPKFNDVLYESTDLINCINWPTYEMVKERHPTPGKVNYVPHAVPQQLYHPLPEDIARQNKLKLLGPERVDHFTALFVSRNARRKMPSDILISWKMFIDDLYKTEGHKNATLMMHCDPLDPEGPNLHQVIDMLDIQNNIIFSNDRIDFNDMVTLYNITDTVVSRSCNEGFGLSVLEAKMCGKPAIALKTGGLTRQIEDHETGEQYGVGIDPEVKCLVGNQMIPYIYEDFCSHETLAKAFMTMYKMGPEKRKEIGNRALAHALKNYDLSIVARDWDVTLTNTIDNWHKTYSPITQIEI